MTIEGLLGLGNEPTDLLKQTEVGLVLVGSLDLRRGKERLVGL